MGRGFAFAVMLLCSCTQGPSSGVELTLRFDDSVSDDTLANVQSLSIASSGDEQGTYAFSLNRAAHREERLVYRSLSASHEIGLAVTATDADGAVLATGSQPNIELNATQATAVEVTLSALAAPDASMTVGVGLDAGVDASSGDGATVIDAGDGGGGCQYALCEDFEAGLGKEWTQHLMNGTITIDGSRPHLGSASMHAHGNAIAAGQTVQLFISEKQTMVPLPPDIYARAYVYVAASPVNLLELMSAVSTVAPYEGDHLMVSVAGDIVTGDSVGANYTSSTSVLMPIGVWACLEWHVHVAADTTGTMDAWLNGAVIPGAARAQATNPTDGLAVMQFGAQFYNAAQANPASDIWVDDIAVDTQRIGCIP